MTGLTDPNGSIQAIPAPSEGPPGLVFDYDDTLGWEGNRSNSPFLFKNMDGGDDWVAEVTIAAQTSGQWSDAGIIVRAKQGTPPGEDADHADENFTFFGSFRTDPANVNAGTTLHKRIEAGAQVQDTNIAVNAGAGNNEPLPIRLRLEKTGADYIGSVSPDNGTTWQVQSTATAAPGTGLADPNVVKEVGLSFAPFGPGDPALLGSATFQNFTLVPPPPGPGSRPAQSHGLEQPERPEHRRDRGRCRGLRRSQRRQQRRPDDLAQQLRHGHDQGPGRRRRRWRRRWRRLPRLAGRSRFHRRRLGTRPAARAATRWPSFS
jgi:hypothetical protein